MPAIAGLVTHTERIEPRSFTRREVVYVGNAADSTFQLPTSASPPQRLSVSRNGQACLHWDGAPNGKFTYTLVGNLITMDPLFILTALEYLVVTYEE